MPDLMYGPGQTGRVTIYTTRVFTKSIYNLYTDVQCDGRLSDY